MPSSNPALTDAIFERESKAAGTGGFDPAWGSPAQELPPDLFAQQGAGVAPPTSGAPTAPTDGQVMRLGGVVSATAVLLGFLMVAAVFGWNSVEVTTVTNQAGQIISTQAAIPPWFFLTLLGAVGLAFLTIFKPKLARITGPIYALLEGTVLGAISKIFDAQYDGIVVSAVMCTMGVFAVMLVLYSSRAIRVTNRLRMGIIAATGAIMLVYLVSIIASLFGANVPMIHDSGPVGILFSVFVVGIAAFNLMLDFDFIERGVAMRAPRYMEWYAAFGLVLTLVWLYLEILRLLAKLRNN